MEGLHLHLVLGIVAGAVCGLLENVQQHTSGKLILIILEQVSKAGRGV